MRWIVLLVTAIASGAPVHAAPQPAVTYAIPNPQRPGAKAADCNTLPETFDGCTFHTTNDEVNRARLPAGPGELWVARASEPALIVLRPLDDDRSKPAPRKQIIELTPVTRADADISVTFDRIAGQPGARRLVESRRVNVMIHASQDGGRTKPTACGPDAPVPC